MRPRGSFVALAAAAGALALALTATPASSSTSTTVPSGTTLTVSVPGRFTGCDYLSPSTSDATRALLDLIRPSAFSTRPGGELEGAPGPITQAELVSLEPQTVVYTIDPTYFWSNGRPFNGLDLQHWYLLARLTHSSLTDGYRSIGSLTVSPTLDQVTVVFARPYADWSTLFRDVIERGTSPACTLSSLVRTASLGPYRLRSISPTTALLVANPTWAGAPANFTRVRLDAGAQPSVISSRTTVDYRYAMTPIQMNSVSRLGGLGWRFGASNGLIVVGFSPHTPTAQRLAIRQSLSYAIDRQYINNQIIGPTTYQIGLAASVLVPQGVKFYPGTPGQSPIDQGQVTPVTTVPSATDVDCTACAATILRAAGYREAAGRWRTASGQPITVRVAIGNAAYDQAVSTMVAREWRSLGVNVLLVRLVNDLAVADALEAGRVDAGVMTIPTAELQGETARAWTGVDYRDLYDIGWRSVLVDQWYETAMSTFNPVDAQPSFTSIDQYITQNAWERPLFTQPTILAWSTDVYGVETSNFVAGVVDQIPSWGYDASRGQ